MINTIKNLIIIIFFILSFGISKAQTDTLTPVPLDKSTLSGIGLEKVDLKDEPEKGFYQKRLYRGDDISVYIVSTETWNNKMNNFPFDEFVYMYHGEAIVKPENGKVQLFHSGDYFFAPKGYTGEWEIKAGDNLHYELSVISTNRADSTLFSKNLEHVLFDKSTLSGAHIKLNENGEYSKVLKKGVELTISLKAEKPFEREIKPAKEMLIKLLSGQITIKSSNGEEKTFYSGDFFIVPKNMIGTWKSKGHGLVKYLTVEKTIY